MRDDGCDGREEVFVRVVLTVRERHMHGMVEKRHLSAMRWRLA